jgi:hypothetical protein
MGSDGSDCENPFEEDSGDDVEGSADEFERLDLGDLKWHLNKVDLTEAGTQFAGVDDRDNTPPELHQPLGEDGEEVDALLRVLDQDLLDWLLECHHLYATQCHSEVSPGRGHTKHKPARSHAAYPGGGYGLEDFYDWLAIFYWMALVRTNDMEDLWSTDELYNNPNVRDTMSLDHWMMFRR